MKAPFGQPVRSYDGNSIKGYWNYLGYYDNYDHLDVIGWQDIKYKPTIYPIYDYITNILYGL
jgi:triacylglycerol lipase